MRCRKIKKKWRLRMACLLATFLAAAVTGGQETDLQSAKEEGRPASAETQEWVRRGNEALAAGNYFQAGVQFETAYRLGAPNERLAATLGNIWYMQGDFRQALFWYEEQIRRETGAVPELHLRRLEMLFRLGEYDKFRTLADDLLADRRTPGHLRAAMQGLQGYAAFQAGDQRQAANLWRTAMENGWEDANAQRFLGSYFLQQDKDSAALKHLRASVRNVPENRTTARQLVLCLLRLQRQREAKEAMVNYLEVFPVDDQTEELLKVYSHFARRQSTYEHQPPH